MGIYLSKPNTTKDSHVGENDFLRFGVSAMQGWRMNMEDSHIALPNFTESTALFAVFDGHGGPEVAKFCSKYMPIELLKNENFKQKNYKAALEEVFLKMDAILIGENGGDFLKEFKNDPENSNSFAGCTANVVLLTPGEVFVANAGDSRAIIYTTEGGVLAMSTDHKPDLEGEKARIQKAGGYVSEGRVNDNLNLSRAIGDLEYKKNPALRPEQQIISAFPDVTAKPVGPGDNFILVGCDGIWETLSAKDICVFVEGKLTANPSVKLSSVVEDVLDRLIAKETMEGVGCDNMSAILIQLKH